METKEAEDRLIVLELIVFAVVAALRRREIADDDFLEEVHMLVGNRVAGNDEQTAIIREWIDRQYGGQSGSIGEILGDLVAAAKRRQASKEDE